MISTWHWLQMEDISLDMLGWTCLTETWLKASDETPKIMLAGGFFFSKLWMPAPFCTTSNSIPAPRNLFFNKTVAWDCGAVIKLAFYHGSDLSKSYN